MDRARFIAKQDAIIKCLGILLDEDLMDFAVYKSSIIRIASNHFVHKQLEDTAVVAEALDTAAIKLVEKAGLPKLEKEAHQENASCDCEIEWHRCTYAK